MLDRAMGQFFETTFQLRDAQLVLDGRADGLQIQCRQGPQLIEQIRLPSRGMPLREGCAGCSVLLPIP